MKISVVTDEISADPGTAIELGVEWGIRDFELRGVGAQRVPRISGYDRQRIHELLDEFQARVVAISPGLFKCPFPTGRREQFPLQAIDVDLYQRWQDARSLVQYHLEELLPQSLEFARELGATRIIVFSFHRGGVLPGPAPDEILQALSAAAWQAGQAGMDLLVEVEDGFWADTGRRSAGLVRAAGQPALGINWDPANAWFAGDNPFPEGYQAVRGLVRHVHFKDASRSPNGELRYTAHGEIDWEGQIRGLAADQYSGYISVEPHLQPKVASAREMSRRLSDLLEKLKDQSGKEG